MGLKRSDPIQLESYKTSFDNGGAALGSAGLVNITNVTGIGILQSIAISINITLGIGGVTATLETQIDAQATQTLPMITAGAIDAALQPFLTLATGINFYLIPMGASRFAISCRVGINVSVNSGTSNINMTVVRGAKI